MQGVRVQASGCLGECVEDARYMVRLAYCHNLYGQIPVFALWQILFP